MSYTRFCDDGRVETYEKETIGQCICGEVVFRIEGSNQTCNADKTRYQYPEKSASAWGIFRCRGCGQPIADNFIPS